MPASDAIARWAWGTALALAAVALGCDGAEEPFVQPGADDPTARQIEKAGGWYPADHRDLDEAIMSMLDEVEADTVRPAHAILTPHASLGYSGATAAKVYARVEIPDRIILLAPDHWAQGEPAAIWTDGPWLVPGHAIAIDDALVDELRTALPDLQPDRVAFENHEEEMQLPFLQLLHPEVRIAPIAVTDNEHRHFEAFDPERIDAWGTAIADIITAHADAGEHVMLLATTDLVHHVPLAQADEEDAFVLDRVAAGDIQGLHDYVVDERVSVCGEIPTAIMMSVVGKLGGNIEILARDNSLHANPDETDVIGYPAAVAWRD